MKKLPLVFAALGALVLIAPSAALAAKGDPKESKGTLMEKYDVNHNGKLDADEVAQIKSDYLADPKGALKRLDTDHDNKLSDEEVAVLAGHKKAEKPVVKKKKNGVE
jgi:hypothetical protein